MMGLVSAHELGKSCPSYRNLIFGHSNQLALFYSVLLQKVSIALLWLFFSTPCFAQNNSDSSAISKDRSWLVAATGIVGTGGSYYFLQKAWYSDTQRSPMHSFNDSKEWLQIDKCGHFITTYQIGLAGHSAFEWAGSPKNRAIWLGGSFGSVYMAGIELLDGQSEEWGFSWSDIAANTAGSMFYIGQEMLWNEQRITPKFSYRKSEFASLRPDVFGSNASERWLKDYNGQVYWLGFNLHCLGVNNSPKWLNLAMGYGADRMISGIPEKNWQNAYPHIQERQREWYLSIDLDLWRIETRSKFLRSFLRAASFIRVPMPAVRFRNDGGLRLIPLI